MSVPIKSHDEPKRRGFRLNPYVLFSVIALIPAILVAWNMWSDPTWFAYKYQDEPVAIGVFSFLFAFMAWCFSFSMIALIAMAVFGSAMSKNFDLMGVINAININTIREQQAQQLRMQQYDRTVAEFRHYEHMNKLDDK
jgi:hypothetical protein